MVRPELAKLWKSIFGRRKEQLSLKSKTHPCEVQALPFQGRRQLVSEGLVNFRRKGGIPLYLTALHAWPNRVWVVYYAWWTVSLHKKKKPSVGNWSKVLWETKGLPHPRLILMKEFLREKGATVSCADVQSSLIAVVVAELPNESVKWVGLVSRSLCCRGQD